MAFEFDTIQTDNGLMSDDILLIYQLRDYLGNDYEASKITYNFNKKCLDFSEVNNLLLPINWWKNVYTYLVEHIKFTKKLVHNIILPESNDIKCTIWPIYTQDDILNEFKNAYTFLNEFSKIYNNKSINFVYYNYSHTNFSLSTEQVDNIIKYVHTKYNENDIMQRFSLPTPLKNELREKTSLPLYNLNLGDFLDKS